MHLVSFLNSFREAWNVLMLCFWQVPVICACQYFTTTVAWLDSISYEGLEPNTVTQRFRLLGCVLICEYNSWVGKLIVCRWFKLGIVNDGYLNNMIFKCSWQTCRIKMWQITGTHTCIHVNIMPKYTHTSLLPSYVTSIIVNWVRYPPNATVL